MNVVFLTMVRITGIEVSGIYQDLMRKFRDEGHDIYIVTPSERQMGLKTSMTESGNPKDNAMAERINSTVKNELLHGKTFTSLKELREAVDKAIAFYNAERPHSSLDWRTPDQAHRMSGEMKKHWHSWREDAIRREQAMAI